MKRKTQQTGRWQQHAETTPVFPISGKNSHDISRGMVNFCGKSKFFIYPVTSRGFPNDVLQKSAWETLVYRSVFPLLSRRRKEKDPPKYQQPSNQTAPHHIPEDRNRVSISLNTRYGSFCKESSHWKQHKETATNCTPIAGFEQASPVFAVNACPNCYYIIHRFESLAS